MHIKDSVNLREKTLVIYQQFICPCFIPPMFSTIHAVLQYILLYTQLEGFTPSYIHKTLIPWWSAVICLGLDPESLVHPMNCTLTCIVCRTSYWGEMRQMVHPLEFLHKWPCQVSCQHTQTTWDDPPECDLLEKDKSFHHYFPKTTTNSYSR